MYIIEVIPLIRGTQLESLSYFSSQEYAPGTFLAVPIRKRIERAMVTECKLVTDKKTALKAATFSLRKLQAQKDVSVVPSALFNTTKTLTKRYPASLGSILFTLLPPDIRLGARTFFPTKGIIASEETTPQVLMARLDERFLAYQSHVRSTFARRGSVLFVVPTITDIAHAAKELGHGISDRIIVLKASDGKKKYEENIAALKDMSFPKLIITTPAFAYIEREDILSIIIEQSASAHYVDRRRPYLDHRDVLILLAKESGRSIILGDTVVRTEEEALRRQDRYLTYGEPQRRMVFSAPLTIIKQNDKPNTEVPFQLFSPRLLETVSRALESKGHVFFYAARRGLAPVVACVDCGYIFRCPDSHTPYSLVRTERNGVEERWFVSSTSGKRVRAADVCPVCNSWRLKERGIGIQQVYDEWREKMPKTDVTVLDHSIAGTPAKAQKIVADFYAKRSGILIGTQIALPYLNRGVDISAIISLDAARSTPTWRADESLFRLLIKLREHTEKEVLIQTRHDPDPLVEYASRGAVERFFDDEIALRKQLTYPPFSTFILLTWSGSLAAVKEAEEIVKHIVTTPLAQYYTNPHSTKENTVRHAFIRIPHEDPTLLSEVVDMVRQVPPYVKVEINPERIV